MTATVKPNSKSAKRAPYFATVPPQEIVPIIDGNYESSVRGIYVIGDVTGLPLVKVAANQGREVIERMEAAGTIAKRDVASDVAHSNGTADPHTGLDLVIVGAGPAGISAAIEAAKRGWKYVLIERSHAASTIRSFPPGKKVYAEPQSIASQSELAVAVDRDKDDFLKVIRDAIDQHSLNLKEETEVTAVRKVGEGKFDVQTASGKSFPCRNVLIAVGRQGQPRLLNVPGADDARKVTYRFHTVEDYADQDVLVVGGGNSAIEAALMLKDSNRVTLSYRGDSFYRAKEENRRLVEQAIADDQLQVVYGSQVTQIRSTEVDLKTADGPTTIANDHVVIQIGSLPPVDFLHAMGLELDGIWTRRRVLWSIIGLLVGIFLYFGAKSFTLLPEKAGDGRWLVPGVTWLNRLGVEVTSIGESVLGPLSQLIQYALPIPWLLLAGLCLLNVSLKQKRKAPLVTVPAAGWWLTAGALLYYLNTSAASVWTLDAAAAGKGPYHLPGFEWLFAVVPNYFANLGGFYYLMYFTAIAVFGIYWAVKLPNPIRWRRNLTIIAVQWTLWWGIPTFLVVFMGTNPWTPLISRSLNAWPLKMDALSIDPSIVRPGDPQWWYTVAVIGVIWAAFLTFVVIPIFTIKFGKIYCSYICSCGALAETVGNGFRHRGPKGDWPRRMEKYGFVFIVMAAVATITSLFGYDAPLAWYNVWVGSFLAGAVAIGFYPFLGQRVWCRMWCPLAFWMNFWGRWSKFKISVEKGKCIDCNVCNQYCQMGIDIKSRALQGEPVTLVDTPCVGCAECVIRCPMEILHLGDLPASKKSLVTLEGSKS